MKNVSILVFLLFGFFAIAQNDYSGQAKADLTILQKQYKEALFKATEARKELKQLDVDSKDYESLRDRSISLDKQLEVLIVNAQTAKSYWLSKGVELEILDSILQLRDETSNKPTKKIAEVSTNIQIKSNPTNEYLLFGTDNAINIKDLNKQSKFILQNTALGFDKKSKNHFGTFKIPANHDSIILTKSIDRVDLTSIETDSIRVTQHKRSLQEDTLVNSKVQKKIKGLYRHGKIQFLKDHKVLYFKKVDIELNEGSVVDIKVQLLDEKGNTHVFTNRTPISFLNFDKTSTTNYLHYTSGQTNISKSYDGYVLRISDVIRYDYTIGGNFVPDDVTFSFPLTTENDGLTNENGKVSYKLEQSTALNNVIELRAYTDIFGLGDSEANGLASIEGQAAFFLNTRNLINRNVFLFKRVRPYLSFSRFEDEDRFVALSPTVDDDGNRGINNNLDLLQKSYFSTGLDLDFLTFKFSKESALETALFATARYQAWNLDLDGDNGDQYTTVGLGGGVNFHLKRFNNFTLDYSLGWIDYRTEGLNDIDGLSDPSNFLVFENMMELSWFPTGDKSSALFARIKTFDDQSKNSDNHFFQAQVGYRFSLGAGAIVKDK